MAGTSLLKMLVAGAVLASCSTATFAQTNSVYRSADAVAGKTLRLGLYGTVKKDCSLGATPEVKVVTPPKHGTLAVRSGKVKSSRVRNCPTLEVPVQGVFYQPAQGYTGPDEISYEVKPAEGRAQTHTVKINVTPQASSKPQPDDEAEL